MPPVPVPDTEFIKSLRHATAIGGRRRWTNAAGDRIFEWDSLHGELEVYNKRGKHLGALDPETGAKIKDAVKGRTIDV